MLKTITILFSLIAQSLAAPPPPPRPNPQGNLGSLVSSMLQNRPSYINLTENNSEDSLQLPEYSGTVSSSEKEITEDDENSAQIPTTSGSPENETVTLVENYDEKLKTILKNIKLLLPILTQLEHNMTQFLLEPQSLQLTKQNGVVPEEENQLKSQEFSPSFTSPAPLKSENPDYVRQLVNTLYPQKSFDQVVNILHGMSRTSQEIAFEVLSDQIFASYRNKSGRMDTIELACEIYGKNQFNQILKKYEILTTTIFPSFFDSQLNFYLEAKSKSDIPKNLYFDRRKNKMGVTSEPTPGIFQSWTFIPVNDGCYFILKSTESDIIVGVIVTKSKESPLLARNIVGVSGLEEGKFNYRFQWKLIPFKVKDSDRIQILLENRETNLALEWNEFGHVHLNSVTFQGNQLWVEGSN